MSEREDISEIQSHKIMTMEEEKRERVLNAAMREFSNGYKKASTDNIVNEAGISKGLLFHYFGTKEKLYDFILNYSFKTIKEELLEFLKIDHRDLLERLWEGILVKIKLSYKYPAIFEFVAGVYALSKENPEDKFSKKIADMQDNFSISDFYANIDTSLFKDGIDVKKATQVIQWTMQIYTDSHITANKTLENYQEEYEMYLKDVKEYFDFFKKIFYK